MLTKTQEQVSRQAKGPEESQRPALTLVASKWCRKSPSIFGTMLMIHSGRGLWFWESNPGSSPLVPPLLRRATPTLKSLSARRQAHKKKKSCCVSPVRDRAVWCHHIALVKPVVFFLELRCRNFSCGAAWSNVCSRFRLFYFHFDLNYLTVTTQMSNCDQCYVAATPVPLIIFCVTKMQATVDSTGTWPIEFHTPRFRWLVTLQPHFDANYMLLIG